MRTCLNTLLLFIFVSCNLQAQHSNLPDSIITLEHTYYYSLTDPEKSQQILDELRIRQSDKPWELDWCQADLYYNTGKYRLAIYYYEKVVQDEEVKNSPELHMYVLSTMMECYRMNNDFEKAMHSAIELVDLAKKQDDKAEIGRAYMLMGTITFRQKNEKLTGEYMRMAEENLLEAGNYEYLYHFYLTYANLLSEYELPEKYEEAYEALKKAELYLRKQEESGNDAFAQQQIDYEYGQVHALASEILSKLGKDKEAKIYFEKFMAGPGAYDIQHRIYIVPYLLNIKDYERAISISKERIENLRNETDTVGENMSAALHHLIVAHQMQGKHEEAIALARKALSLEKKKRIRDSEDAALELAAIYNVQEKETRLAEQANIIQRRNMLLIGSLIITLLLIVTIVLIVRNMTQTRKSNLSMVQQIKVMQRNRERLELILKESTKEKREKLLPSAADKQTIEDIFTTADEKIRDEKLYLNPNLTRDDVINLMHTKRNDFIQAINNSTGMSFTDYINSIRLEEALNLLETSGYSMVVIAEKSGFGSERSFYRQFKQKYNMSPAEYKKLVE